MLLNTRLPLSYIFKKIRIELFYILLIALIVYYITKEFSYLIPEIPIAIPTFLGTAISVILSFKLNQSYDRWWEARKIWGTIVNESRNLVLQLQAFTQNTDTGIVKTIAYRQIAWCYSLGQSLRQKDATANLEAYLSGNDISAIKTHNNKPLAILQLNNRDIKTLADDNRIDRFSQVQLNNTIVALTNAMGMAERIKSTIFPATYRLFLHMIIYLFIVLLSISLRNLQSYFEIPLLITISSLFFLLERTATHLQDPFSDKPTDTPVTTIATTIETNIKQLLDEKDIPPMPEPGDFYIK